FLLLSCAGDDLVCQLDPCDIMKLGVKIADLGSACWTPVCKEIQTQPYRALEVLLGLDYSTPADIWSTGCLAFEMVTGERLFETPWDHIARIIELLGSIPPSMALSWKGASAFFSRRGERRGTAAPQKWVLGLEQLQLAPFLVVCPELPRSSGSGGGGVDLHFSAFSWCRCSVFTSNPLLSRLVLVAAARIFLHLVVSRVCCAGWVPSSPACLGLSTQVQQVCVEQRVAMTRSL
uniref:non-specific serine/threonine protein kinase n=1 Tax=Crocodylus porosus TaxID=8502 RepID=A0A7M4FIX7_CROPO